MASATHQIVGFHVKHWQCPFHCSVRSAGEFAITPPDFVTDPHRLRREYRQSAVSAVSSSCTQRSSSMAPCRIPAMASNCQNFARTGASCASGVLAGCTPWAAANPAIADDDRARSGQPPKGCVQWLTPSPRVPRETVTAQPGPAGLRPTEHRPMRSADQAGGRRR